MIIAICGRAQAGKDTVFSIIEELKSSVFEVERIAFADNVKKIAAGSLGITVEELEEYKTSDEIWSLGRPHSVFNIPKFPFYTRQFLQRIGTECGRNIFGENVWIDLVFKNIDNKNNKKLYVITDCRFENEAKKIKESGGYIIRINRKIADDKPILHSSEQADLTQYIDYYLNNNSTKEDLKKQINIIFDNLKTKL